MSSLENTRRALISQTLKACFGKIVKINSNDTCDIDIFLDPISEDEQNTVQVNNLTVYTLGFLNFDLFGKPVVNQRCLLIPIQDSSDSLTVKSWNKAILLPITKMTFSDTPIIKTPLVNVAENTTGLGKVGMAEKINTNFDLLLSNLIIVATAAGAVMVPPSPEMIDVSGTVINTK